MPKERRLWCHPVPGWETRTRLLVCGWLRRGAARQSKWDAYGRGMRRTEALCRLRVPHVLSLGFRQGSGHGLFRLPLPGSVRWAGVSTWPVLPTAGGAVQIGAMSTTAHVQEGQIAGQSLSRRLTARHRRHRETIPLWPGAGKAAVSTTLPVPSGVRKRLRSVLPQCADLPETRHLSSSRSLAVHWANGLHVRFTLLPRLGVSEHGEVLLHQGMPVQLPAAGKCYKLSPGQGPGRHLID